MVLDLIGRNRIVIYSLPCPTQAKYILVSYFPKAMAVQSGAQSITRTFLMYTAEMASELDMWAESTTMAHLIPSSAFATGQKIQSTSREFPMGLSSWFWDRWMLHAGPDIIITGRMFAASLWRGTRLWLTPTLPLNITCEI